jgi:hypothetical protein
MPSATRLEIHVQLPVEGLETLALQSADVIVAPLTTREVDYGLKLLRATARVLKKEGSVFLFLRAVGADPLLPHELLVQIQPILNLRNEFHWFNADEPNTDEMLDDDQHEYVFQLTNSQPSHEQKFSSGGRCIGTTTWFCKRETEDVPTEIITKCVRIHGWQTNLVMVDTSVSDGNSAIAALEMGIAGYIGFSPNPGAVTRATERASKRRADLDYVCTKLDRPNK